MTEDTSRRVAITSSERARMRSELALIVGRAGLVSEHLTVAAARADTRPSAWTEAQLDAIIEAARALSRAITSAPIEGD